MIDEPQASALQLLGAGGFGAILGWYLYFINRYRSADVRMGHGAARRRAAADFGAALRDDLGSCAWQS